MPPGDWATWAAAVFTGSAVFVALWQIHVERRERQKVERRAEEEQKRRQATKVSAWITKAYDDPMWIAVRNSSDEPVYEVIVSLVSVQGAGPPRDAHDTEPDFRYRAFLSVVPPGRFYASMPYGGHGMSMRFGLEVAFTDASGQYWVRKGNGDLSCIATPAIDYYRVHRPVGWDYPVIESMNDIPGKSRNEQNPSLATSCQ